MLNESAKVEEIRCLGRRWSRSANRQLVLSAESTHFDKTQRTEVDRGWPMAQVRRGGRSERSMVKAARGHRAKHGLDSLETFDSRRCALVKLSRENSIRFNW